MTAADVWPALMDDAVLGGHLRMSLSILAMVSAEKIAEAIARLDRETTIGPMIDPTAYLDGSKFDNAKQYMKVLRAAYTLRMVLPGT